METIKSVKEFVIESLWNVEGKDLFYIREVKNMKQMYEIEIDYFNTYERFIILRNFIVYRFVLYNEKPVDLKIKYSILQKWIDEFKEDWDDVPTPEQIYNDPVSSKTTNERSIEVIDLIGNKKPSNQKETENQKNLLLKKLEKNQDG